MSEKRTVKCRRQALTLKQKVDIIGECYESKRKHREVAAEFGVERSTVTKILKEKDFILQQYNASADQAMKKKLRKSKFDEIEACLIEWVRQARQQNSPITETTLLQKAKNFAEMLDVSDFAASDGWLRNFKQRHDSYFNSDYSPDEVFICMETGIFYKLLPQKTSTLKNEHCSDGKHSKERLTIMLCCNSTGSAKEKPLVIGKLANSPLKGKDPPAVYYQSRKVWMSNEIFENWLKLFDARCIAEKRRVLLIVNSDFSYHVDNLQLRAVKLQFSSQPTSASIIRQFKIGYRIRLLQRLLLAIDNQQTFNYDVSLKDAVDFTVAAWNNVNSNIISNCFRQTTADRGADKKGPESCDIWDAIAAYFTLEFPFEEYVSVDDAVAVNGTYTDRQIVKNALFDRQKPREEEQQGSEAAQAPLSTTSEAMRSLRDIELFLELNNCKSDYHSAISKLEDSISAVASVNVLRRVFGQQPSTSASASNSASRYPNLTPQGVESVLCAMCEQACDGVRFCEICGLIVHAICWQCNSDMKGFDAPVVCPNCASTS